MQCPFQQAADVRSLQRAELEHLTAADERRHQREERIRRRRSDENHDTVFHIRQQHILLRLVEVVQFVDKQHRFLPGVSQSGQCRREHIPEVLHSRSRRIELLERGLAVCRYDLRQSRLACPGRSEKDERLQPAGGQHPPQ